MNIYIYIGITLPNDKTDLNKDHLHKYTCTITDQKLSTPQIRNSN